MRKEDILNLVQYLHDAGMPEKYLAEIHHLDQPETYNSSLQYFASGGEVKEGGTNEHYARRLHHLVEGHREGRTDWRTMTQEARAAWPI